MWPYRATKELIQVGYEPVDGPSPRLVPKTAIEHVLEAMRLGGADRAFIVLSPVKWEVFRYLGAGERLQLQLTYLCQEKPLGMPVALDLARPFLGDATVCFGMPDTIVSPSDCFAKLLAFHEARGADVSLGVFNTDQPRELAPVLLDPDTGRVLDIVDKPEEPPVANTWGIAVWSPAFTELLGEFVAAGGGDGMPELLLSDAFLSAVSAGLSVYGLSFPDSTYHDIGTPAGLMRTRAVMEGHHHRLEQIVG